MKPSRHHVRAIASGALVWLLSLGGPCAAELQVAHIGPYSGPTAALGAEYGAGARLYFDYVNGHGGINGARIVLTARDDTGDPGLTHQHAIALISTALIAFIGTAGVGNVNTVASLLESLQIPLVGPVLDAEGVETVKGHTIFHIQPNARQEVNALVGQLHSLGFRKIALCDQSTAKVDGPRKEMPDAIAIKPVVIPECEKDMPSVERAADAVVAAGAQAVVFVGLTRPAADFIVALRNKRSFAMVVTSSSVNADALATMLPAGSKTWLATAETFPRPLVREFFDVREAAESPIPLTRTSLAGFVSAKIVVEAIRRAGPNATSAGVLKALREPRPYEVGGMTLDFSRAEDHRLAYTRLDIISSRQ